MTPRQLIVLVLRLSAAVLLLATLAMFLPTEWMRSIHEFLGMGDFPESAVVEYLTRSLSALYAMHGAIILAVSFDVSRYWKLIRLLAILNIVFGVLLLAIGIYAPMPWFWVLFEGPPIVGLGVGLLYLQKLSGDPEDDESSEKDDK